MDRYTEETLHWLELRYDADRQRLLGIDYQPYQVLGGVADGAWTPSHFLMAARLVRLLAILRVVRPESFLDVGGSEGLVADLVSRTFGIPSVTVDLSRQAGLRAREYLGVPAAAVDSARLPFEDASFDVVFMSEVLEHLAQPIRSLLEMRRVSKGMAFVTTEAFAASEAERDEELAERRIESHMDRSIFCAADLDAVFADRRRFVCNQCSRIPVPLPQDGASTAKALREVLMNDDLVWPAHGIIMLAGPKAPVEFPHHFVEEAIDRVMEVFAARRRERSRLHESLPDAAIVDRLACPRCHGAMQVGEHRITCSKCGGCFDVDRGVPAFWCKEADDDLEARLGAEFEDRPDVLKKLTALDRKLHLELPQPIPLEQAFETFATWIASDGCRIATSSEAGAFTISSSAMDPMLTSPRLGEALDCVRGLEFECRVNGASRPVEQLQLYFKTLRWPLHLDRHSVVVDVPADGRWHRVSFGIPEWLEDPTDDELFELRLDPSHGEAEIEVRAFRVERRD